MNAKLRAIPVAGGSLADQPRQLHVVHVVGKTGPALVCEAAAAGALIPPHSRAPRNSVHHLAVGLLACLAMLISIGSARANTLFFQASLDSMGNPNDLWSTVSNWYTQLIPTPVPAGRLPNSDDSAVITTTVVVDVPSVILQTMIVQGATTINGGLIQVGTLQTTGSTFEESTVTVKSEWDEFDNVAMGDCTVFIDSGAIWYVEQQSGGNTAELSNCNVTNIGGITLYDQSVIEFVAGTNVLALLDGAQLVGNGTSVVAAGGNYLTFDNNGSVIGNAGTFQLSFGANTFWTDSENVGNFTTTVSNGVVQILGNYELQTGTTNKVTGPGLTWFYGSISAGSINGLLQIGDTNAGPGTAQSDAVFSGTGTIDVIGSAGQPSTFVWEQGTLGSNLTMNIDPFSQLVLSNDLTKLMSGSVINNSGTATWVTDNGTLQMDNGAVFNNGPGALFLVENNATVLGGAGSGLSFFNNAGTVRKIIGTSDTIFQQDNPPAPAVVFNNSGLLDVQSGGMLLSGGTNSSQFNIGAGGLIEFFHGTNTQSTGANFTGSAYPTVVSGGDFWLANNLTFSGLFVNGGTVDGPGTLGISGSLIGNGGTFQGAGLIDIDLGGSFDVTNTVTMNRSVNNSGAATNGSSILAGVPVSWNNSPGSWTILQNGGTFDFTYSGAAPLFNNAGTLENISSNVSCVMNWFVTNSGTIVVNPYGIQFADGPTQIAGSTVVSNGALMTVFSSHNNEFLIQGGTLSGTGTVQGLVANWGTIHPGYSPGVLTINGTVSNDASAIFAAEIDGTMAGSQYSQLNDSGDNNFLSGELNVTYGGGFLPSVGQSFVVVSNAQINGTFSSLSGLRAPNGVLLVPEYSQQMVTLVAANSPNITSTSHSGSTTSFDVQTTTGLTNVVEFSPSLSTPSWHAVGTIVGDGTIKEFIDPSETSPDGFYRVTFE